MNSSCIPPQYTSAYHQYQLKKYLLPEKYKSSYEFLFQKIQDLKQEYALNEIEANCLKECMKEIPEIGCQIQWSLYQREQIGCEIESALLHKDLKCKAPLIEPNLRRNLGKWST